LRALKGRSNLVKRLRLPRFARNGGLPRFARNGGLPRRFAPRNDNFFMRLPRYGRNDQGSNNFGTMPII